MSHHRFHPAPLTLALAAAFLSLSGPAGAQTAAPTISVTIPAQPLGSALNDLARQARLQLMLDAKLVEGKSAPAVSGSLTVRQAFDRVLAGSGLRADVSGSDVVVRRVVQPATAGDATLAPVTVTAESTNDATSLKRRVATGALGSRSALETPFSVTSVGREEIEERLVTTTEQVFRYDASTQLTGGEYGQSASFSVRGLGLDSTNAYKIDGLPVAAWGANMPLEPYERVDLLKGLSGFMHGFGSPGGIANYVLKRPTDEFAGSVSLGYKADSIWTEALDIGGRAGADKRFGYRVNLAHEEGDTYVKGGGIDRTTASLALDARLTSDLTATFDTVYTKRLSTGNNFWGVDLNAVGALPRTVDPSIATQPSGSYYNTVDRISTAGLQWRIAPDWTASFSYRTTQRDIDYNYSTLYVNNLNGNYSADRGDYRFQQNVGALQAQVEGRVRTGGIGHQLVFGASSQKITTNSDRASSYTGFIGTGNLYTNSMLAISGNAAGHPLYKSGVIEQNALFASDTIAFSDRWSLIAGARYTKFDQIGLNQSGVTTARYQRDPLTPTLALLFKPTTDSTVYTSAVESLERGGTAPATASNAYEVMGPVKSRQLEFGYKIDRPGWSASAALFRIEKAAEYTNAANRYVQDGNVRYQGLDLNGRLRVTPTFSLLGGLMLMESTYIESAAALQGKRTTGTPRAQAALRAEWRVAAVPGLGLSLGGKYVGSSMMNNANTYKLPGYTVLDAGASYVTRMGGRDVTFTAALQNLADRQYWVYNGGNYVIPGAPRTLSVSARLAF